MTSSSPIVAAATELAAMLETNARQTDAQGLSAEQVAALAKTGALNPADLPTRMEVGRALAQGCGASAYFAIAASTAATLTARMGAAKDLNGEIAMLAPFANNAALTRKGADWSMSGAWASVGGLDHAQWVLVFGLEHEGERYCALLKSEDASAEALTLFGGLRGLNWKSLIVTDVTLPAHRVARESDILKGEETPMLGALLGTLEAGYHDYARITRARVAGVGGQAVARFTQVQSRLAESHAELKALRAIYADLMSKIAEASDDPLVLAEMARDRAYLAHKSVETLNRLLTQMGAMGLAESNSVQRRFRDLRAFAAMPGQNWNAQMSAFGRRELGVPEEDANAAA